MQTYFRPGDWNANCEMCGFRFKASSMRKRWDGAMVCKRCWEPRNSQDFVKGVVDNISVPWSRNLETIFPLEGCTLAGGSCYADYAVADCAICDNTTYDPEFLGG